MKRKVLALVLVLTVLLGTSAPLLAASAVSAEETVSAAKPDALAAAGALYKMGLFLGTGTDGADNPRFELERESDRCEAVVMLVRLLGREQTAKAGSFRHPFTDVPSWADKYVAYAYAAGLTKGTGTSAFGSTQKVTAQEYLTFVLRALGYSDAEGDFTYSAASLLSDSIGLTNGEYGAGGAFLRGDMAVTSYAALSQTLRGSATTLVQSLVTGGNVTRAAAEAAGLTSALGTAADSGRKLSAEEIYAKCAPAVFAIAVYDAAGETIATGSGFFISGSGTAVTNCHVIKGASSAKITLSDSGETYNVAGVYSYDTVCDLALLKVNGSGFSYLALGAGSTVVGGATVYAIGNPQGFQSSISQGIISNPKRIVGNNPTEYVQMTAQISSGSSGGAVLNEYGQVIAVSSGTWSEGQNINFAVPTRYLQTMSTSSVMTLSEVTSRVNAEVKAATEALLPTVPQPLYTVDVSDAALTIPVTFPGISSGLIHCESTDGSIVQCGWGEWKSAETCGLNLAGASAGETTVGVWFEDELGNVSRKLTFTVVVTDQNA